MKKNFIYGIILTAVAAVFASCTVDDATDGFKPSGATKTVTLTSDVNVTRTALGADHALTWAEGDKYGIYCVAADGKTVLDFIASPEYSSSVSSYTLTVPEETKYFYCVYPYNESASADDDITKISVYIPYWENTEQYEFNGNQHLMAAKAEISASNTVNVVFDPLVSIAEFNLYSTKGDGTELFCSLDINVGENDPTCAGSATVDFTGEKPVLDNASASYVYAGAELDKEPAIGTSREEGLKVYALVAKNTYSTFDVTISTSLKNTWSGDFEPYKFPYKNISMQKDGRTFNIDLSKPVNAPLVELQVAASGPWTAFALVEKSSNCSKYVIGAMPTANLTDSEGDEIVGSGFDLEYFINDAELSLAIFEEGWGSLKYMVYTESEHIDQIWMLYDGYDNFGWTEPTGLRISDKVPEYTVAVYAVPADGGEAEVYTATFKPETFALSDNAAPEIAEAENDHDKFSAEITAAEDVDYLFYGYSDGDSAPSAAEIKAMFENGEGQFIAYKEAVTYDVRKPYSDAAYTVWAVAITKGQLSQVGSKTFAPEAMSFDGTAKVTGFTPQELLGRAPYIYLQAQVTLTDDASLFAVWDMPDDGWKATSGITIDYLRNYLAEELAKGTTRGDNVYSASDAKFGISFYFPNETAPHHSYALAMDASGAFGPLVNLADPTLTVDDPEFMTKTYTFGDDGGDEPDVPEDIWNNTITDSYTNWLTIEDISVFDDGGYSADVSWKGTSAAGVKSVIQLRVRIDQYAEYKGVDGAVQLVKEAFDEGYTTKDGTANMFLSGDVMFLHGNNFASLDPDSPRVKAESEYSFNAATGLGTVYVTLLADENNQLTVKVAGYVDSETHEAVLTNLFGDEAPENKDVTGTFPGIGSEWGDENNEME